ncbi:MAG: PDZ domain-containing protein [Deltaproteobacteria bacterium]|nr:MAG: PDZ domain-containing protein [Deltaproteobacteria bacterium]
MRRRTLLLLPLSLLLLCLGWWLWPRSTEVAAVVDAPTPSREGARLSRSSVPEAAPEADAAPDLAAEAGSEAPDDPAARAEALIADPNTHVVCDLGPDVPDGQAYLSVGGHSDFNGRIVQVVDGRAYLPLVYDLGPETEPFDIREGLFSLEGYGPVAIAWSDRPESGHGTCTAVIEPDLGRASLTGSITLRSSGAPADGAWLEGCGNLAFADGQGVVHMDIVPEPCSVIAMRQDGLLRTMSDRIEVTPKPGEDVILDIAISDLPRGGLGVRVAETDDGIVIEGVLDGGPAQTAGLAEGDRVVEVDGENADDLSLGDFVEVVGGDAGTSVDLTVDRGGELVRITVVREVLSAG